MKINALGTMLVLTAGTVAFAQQAAAPQLEVPYQCAEITVTIHRCGKVGGQDVCMYRVDIPGSQSVEAQLKSCKLQPGGATRTPGQALNPAYLSEMPSADRVMKALKTSDPRETALRQMGAFYQLSEIIKTLSGPREIRGYMPDEQGILQEYNVALRPDGNLEGAGTVKVAGRWLRDREGMRLFMRRGMRVAQLERWRRRVRVDGGWVAHGVLPRSRRWLGEDDLFWALRQTEIPHAPQSDGMTCC